MKKLFFVFACLVPVILHAQTTKTDVLVIGHSAAAFAAAVQASESGVNSIVLTQNDGFKWADFKIDPANGLMRAFEKQARKSLKLADSIALPKMNNQMAGVVIKNWSDSSKLFEVMNNKPYYELKRSGNGWELKLSKEKSIKAKVLVLADQPEQLLSALKVTALPTVKAQPLSYADNLYRSSIAGFSNSAPSFLSLYTLLIPNQENLIYLTDDSFEMGQAAGATAAYAAFYQTKTSLSSLKRIQGELLSYKLALIPLHDIKPADPNWLAIQKISITGILKAYLSKGGADFHPDQEVQLEEVKQPIKDYYYKAQIWFDDHQNEMVNLENTISLVCYVGNKSVEATKTELQKKWTKSYKFTAHYDLKKVLTRREFAVIINDYLKPFDEVNVDRTGRVIR